jgi:hypothetical protein
VAAYIWADREEEAHAVAKKVLKVFPNFSIRQSIARIPRKNRLVLNNWAEALRKAGLPD